MRLSETGPLVALGGGVGTLKTGNQLAVSEKTTHFRVRAGLRPNRKGKPEATIEQAARPVATALVGLDFPGLRPSFKVAQGDRVAEGEPLFVDRSKTDIVFVSPVCGRVTHIAYGPKRSLSSIVVEQEPAGHPGQAEVRVPEGSDPETIREVLLARGMWPAFRTRPYGFVPAPDVTPEAIFVNAVTAGTHRPDPLIVLKEHMDAFRHGLAILTQLTSGPVHLVQNDRPALYTGPKERVQVTRFSGRHAAALSGTHIHRLHPVGIDRQVWTIGFQDVAAIGSLFLTGRYEGRRVVALAGPRAVRPRLLRVPMGTNLRTLLDGETTMPKRPRQMRNQVRILSGDEVCGRPAAYLGRYHDQITIDEGARRKGPGSLARLEAARALIPVAALESTLPFDVLPVPLMRALAVGDTETAHRLGCLELIEEDVALLTRRCTSGADYGALLRGVLDEIAKDAA
ncbi:MAG: hypothetical protein JJ920_18965 [Roseitalea sp.]|jgi:Na+-transporting NADH:ubiquinone oxidoreductase subunit A|nr:hypothetical protein [Roseitalea sp.]MBO6722209.1 hypothetical protein [Roseitalea sp.]MBO6745000.1 hypothetical protein [Roseitalea sp.]